MRQVVDALLSQNDVHIVLGESLLGDRLKINLERVHIIRDYPNAYFFNAFDISVQAGGYNSFHEMRKQGIPTLFLPNMNTGMDDQFARCKVAENEGWGIVHSSGEISESIENLLSFSPKNNIQIGNNGNDTLAKYLL